MRVMQHGTVEIIRIVHSFAIHFQLEVAQLPELHDFTTQ